MRQNYGSMMKIDNMMIESEMVSSHKLHQKKTAVEVAAEKHSNQSEIVVLWTYGDPIDPPLGGRLCDQLCNVGIFICLILERSEKVTLMGDCCLRVRKLDLQHLMTFFTVLPRFYVHFHSSPERFKARFVL